MVKSTSTMKRPYEGVSIRHQPQEKQHWPQEETDHLGARCENPSLDVAPYVSKGGSVSYA
eukprot:5286693-Amphidinium_carterae.2